MCETNNVVDVIICLGTSSYGVEMDTDSDIGTLVPNGKLVRVRRIANRKRRSTRGVERAKLNTEEILEVIM